MIGGALTLAITCATVLGTADAPATSDAPASDATGDRAGERTAALAPLRWEGEAQAPARLAVQERLEQETADPEITWIPASRVAAAAAQVGECADPKCHQRLGERAGATFVVVPTVKLRDRVYQVSFQVIAVDDGEVVAQTSEFCEICGVHDVASMVAEQAAAIRPELLALLRGLPVLEVFTTPDAAEVLIDGAIAGTSPLTTELTAGRHLVRVEKPGRVAQERELLAVEGVTETLRIELPAVPGAAKEPAEPSVAGGRPAEPPTSTPTRPRADRAADRQPDRQARAIEIAGWSAVGSGVALLAVGIPLRVLDGRQDERRCSGSDVDVNGTCRYTWATGPVGTALLVTGSAFVTTGAIMLIARRQRTRSTRTAKLRWGPTFGGAALTGRF